MTFDLKSHIERQREFSLNTFGPGARTAGVGRITRAQMDAIESGKRIRENRLARNVSMAEEARRLGISVSEYSAIEHGRVWASK